MKFGPFLLVKYIEAVIAFYAFCIGVLFLSDPTVLGHSVYNSWKEAGPLFWSLILIFVSVLHIFALWLNGRSRRLSRFTRAVGCMLHFYIALQFAIFFYEGGAVWGSFTMGLLVCGVILPIMISAIEDIKATVGEHERT